MQQTKNFRLRMLDFSTRSTLNLVHSATPFFLSWAASLPALRSSLPVRRPSWPPSSKLLSRHVKTCPMNLCVPSIVFGNFELRYYNSETTEGSSSSSQNREPGLLLRSSAVKNKNPSSPDQGVTMRDMMSTARPMAACSWARVWTRCTI